MKRAMMWTGTLALGALLLLSGANSNSFAQEQPPIDFSNAFGGILDDGVTLRVDGVRLNVPPAFVGNYWGSWRYDTALARWVFNNVGAAVGTAGGGPFDTYFGLAVVDNGELHAGNNLLFLDFDGTTPSPGVIVSPRVDNGAVRLDGNASDWNPTRLSAVRGRVMNNYPLSEFYDATNTNIVVGSAYDQQYVYFLVRWVDANLDRSDMRNQWVFGLGGWGAQGHVAVNPSAPQANVVNRGDRLRGTEEEDRIFMLFPINDTEGNFVDGGLGCGAYCHGNLRLSPDPATDVIGEGVAVMGTNVEGDTADEWHWKAARTAPMGKSDDRYFRFATGTEEGRSADSGRITDGSNSNAEGTAPAFMPVGQGLSARVLYTSAVLPFDQTGYPVGATLPFNVMRPARGSRGNVDAADSFDPVTGTWTVEFRRALYTGNSDDHQFAGVGSDATPPSDLTGPNFGDPSAGQALYGQVCQPCHQPNGAGLFSSGQWVFPRVQRTSGTMIRRAIRYVSAMSAIQLDAQQAEDIGAFLQTQFTAAPP